ncbi:MAG: protein kinase, partial [Lachnospiraceae bacterium]|nr:protein kinase [Lachnospiraceae bacterium]
MEENRYQKYEPIFGHWYIKQKLGEGGYGEVYEIERTDFGNTYRAALKAITIPRSDSERKSIMSEGLDESQATDYFREVVSDMSREFALMDRLKGNSYIVSYEDHAVHEHADGLGWDILIRMELLTPLGTYLQTHQMSEQDVIRFGMDLCRALELCGQHKIIHRDIKPENIFHAESGTFKLGDFGVARIAERTTGASTRVGTQAFTAPEIYSGSR